MVFKKVMRELERLKREQVAVPIRADERGYLDRECPAEACKFIFKVLIEDWTTRLKNASAHCPRCGHTAPDDHWWTTDQLKRARAEVGKVVRARIGNALQEDARAFNTTAPRSLISISMNVSGRKHSTTAALPVEAVNVLEQTLVCEKCGAGFAVLGSAFFCPCCGHNSVERMFDGALAKVRAKIDGLEVVRGALAATLGADEADTFCASTVENGLQDCVVAFQHLAERLYVSPAGAKPPRRNVFQSLDEGSELWRSAVGKGYDDWLSAKEYRRLDVLFQRRHLLAHREGLVDDKYVKNSGDVTYRPGQRIVVLPADVTEMVGLVEKLGTAIRAASTPTKP
ncbi:MAG: hypothetical protein IPK60_10350 [Sandaracinaceae bacterium]|nr:hypothetical protein [Sandaracinaceae bacterium]